MVLSVSDITARSGLRMSWGEDGFSHRRQQRGPLLTQPFEYLPKPYPGGEAKSPWWLTRKSFGTNNLI